MNLKDWENLESFESVIPCTTPTWALYAVEGEVDLQRIVAWQVTQNLERGKDKPEVWAVVSGLAAGLDGVSEVAADSTFVGYLDETELPTAQARVTERTANEARRQEVRKSAELGAGRCRR